MKIILTLISAFVALVHCHSFEPDYLKRSYDEGSLLVQNTEDYRLTDDAVPTYYKLTITPFLGQQKHFLGEVVIDFTAKNDSNKIVLNQEHLNITSQKLVMVLTVWTVNIELTGCKNIDEYQTLECTLAEETLKRGYDYRLTLQYEGLVHDDMRGFYESYYYNEDNEKQTFGLTHFGQQARRLMPCFDEPRFKAQFQLNIGYNPTGSYRTISNTYQNRTNYVNDTWIVDEFKRTSVISPSLLAFVISDFDWRNGRDSLSVYARPNAMNQVGFAVDLGTKVLRVLGAWNGILYDQIYYVEKLHIVALPDFPAGAMENWGLLMFREVNVLFDYEHTNTQQEQKIALTISHEIAHMWFKGYVTCNATWLDEGLATYFQFIGVDPVHKDWNVMDDFVVSTLQNALSADAVRSSSLVIDSVSTITHDKVASLLRMMHNIMRINDFQYAIKAYLKNHPYNTTVPEDLFDELEKVDHDNISPKEIMKSYIEQSGYPLVTAKLVRHTQYDANILILTQKRFLIDEIDHNLTSKWTIPITHTVTEDDFLKPDAYLTIFRNESLNITTWNMKLDYFILNVQQVGFYRVNYDKENWLAIGKALKSYKHGRIHVLNRAQIIDDLFNLARAGYLTYDFIFNIIDYVKEEEEYLPWQATLNGLSYLMQRIPDENYKNVSFTFVNNLLSEIYKKLDFSYSNPHQDNLNRINILNWACKYGNEECQKRAKKEFYNVIRKNEDISPDWKPAVYCTGLRNTTGNWDKLWDRYVKTNYATEQATILAALGCTKKEKEINKFLDKILTDEIKVQDKSSAYYSAYTSNLENVDIVYNYVTKNHAKWSEVMDLGSSLSDLANRFTTTAQVDELEKFISGTKLTEGVKTKLKAAVDQSKKNLEWDSKRLIEVKSYLDAKAGSAGTIKILKLLVLVLAIANVFPF